MMLLSRNPNVCTAELDGEICLFEPSKAVYLNLNKTGSSIWNLLEEATTLDKLVSALQELYDVDADTCRRETANFLNEARLRGMLKEQSLA